MNPSISHPVAVVVGVGPGLGAALARRFAAGYTVAVIARRESYLNGLVKEIETAGGRALGVPTDVAQEEQICAAFERIRRELGTPDVLLFNAAMRPVGRLMETKSSTFENTWRVSVMSAFLCAQQVVPDMLTKGKGTILVTGATAG